MSRKKIAVLSAEIFNQYINRIIDGISRQGTELGYDVAIFVMSLNDVKDNDIRHGAENIYTLINPESFAGVLMISGDSFKEALMKKFKEKFATMNIPVLAIDFESEICDSIYANDLELFEMITDHFADNHGFRDIMCFTGPENNIPAQSRLLGYKKSLEKHGIKYDESNVVYGDFWKDAAKNLAKEFVEGKRKLPQAIVCGNDVMAITLCNNLISNGIYVPDDVMISGYDCTEEAIDNIPSITSLNPENIDLGMRAVCKLHNLITGIDIQPEKINVGSIRTAQSCGCNQEIVELVKAREENYHNFVMYEELYRDSGMEERLFCTKNLDELVCMIQNFTYIINGLEKYMMCLCEDWNNVSYDIEEEVPRDGYSENMIAKIFNIDSNEFYEDINFKSKDIVPNEKFYNNDKPKTFFLLPLHFNERCFGYSVFTFKNIKFAKSSLFARWSRNFNVALEFLRVRTKLVSMNQRIFLSSIRDTLTGIYNRKGFKRYSESLFKKAKSERNKLFILFVDLDGLKVINDNYGHMEGDNAIIVAANVLNSCCKNNEVCARLGGDEYAVIGCYNYTDDILDGYVKYIHDYFERYNKSSGKPYKVEASIGYFCGVPDLNSELQQYLNIADKKMYDNKFKRKGRK